MTTSVIFANVIWPYHAALWVQLIPVFLLIEALVLFGYFPGARARVLLGALLANLASTFVGLFTVTPFEAFWDPLRQIAAYDYWACIVAFVITLPIEFFILLSMRKFEDRKRLFRAVFMMNFLTYAICIAAVTYHWRWGASSDWDELIEAPIFFQSSGLLCQQGC